MRSETHLRSTRRGRCDSGDWSGVGVGLMRHRRTSRADQRMPGASSAGCAAARAQCCVWVMSTCERACREKGASLARARQKLQRVTAGSSNMPNVSLRVPSSLSTCWHSRCASMQTHENGAVSGRERGSRGRHGWWASTRGHWHAASATFRAGARAFSAPHTWSSRALESLGESECRSVGAARPPRGPGAPGRYAEHSGAARRSQRGRQTTICIGPCGEPAGLKRER